MAKPHMSRKIMAMIIDGQEIEDIFVDETMRTEVDPSEYYGLTKDEIDIFLYHAWYFETRGKLLIRTRDRVWLESGKQGVQQMEYKLTKEYERDWHHVRIERGIIT